MHVLDAKSDVRSESRPVDFGRNIVAQGDAFRWEKEGRRSFDLIAVVAAGSNSARMRPVDDSLSTMTTLRRISSLKNRDNIPAKTCAMDRMTHGVW